MMSSGQFNMSIWVMVSGMATWMGGVFSWSAS